IVAAVLLAPSSSSDNTGVGTNTEIGASSDTVIPKTLESILMVEAPPDLSTNKAQMAQGVNKRLRPLRKFGTMPLDELKANIRYCIERLPQATDAQKEQLKVKVNNATANEQENLKGLFALLRMITYAFIFQTVIRPKTDFKLENMPIPPDSSIIQVLPIRFFDTLTCALIKSKASTNPSIFAAMGLMMASSGTIFSDEPVSNGIEYVDNQFILKYDLKDQVKSLGVKDVDRPLTSNEFNVVCKQLAQKISDSLIPEPTCTMYVIDIQAAITGIIKAPLSEMPTNKLTTKESYQVIGV
ncbi:hypothetical protein EBU71_17170, partial [bacterium]|nr:hypothetical protein [Candidatus Elulimicrobium humile]